MLSTVNVTDVLTLSRQTTYIYIYIYIYVAQWALWIAERPLKWSGAGGDLIPAKKI